MSKQFIEEKIGRNNLYTAQRQQNQLSYFTQSQVQHEEYGYQYWEDFSSRYRGNDTFLQWVCNIFHEDNFRTFCQYLRFPLPSAKIVDKKIKPDLKRVFFSEDSFFRYIINGEQVPEPIELKSKEFNNTLFSKLLFNFNDIIFHDLTDINTPKRYFVPIETVIAIESTDSVIHRIAFESSITVTNDLGEEEIIYGYLYADPFSYIFYDREFKRPPIEFPHDLEETPADYLTSEAFRDGYYNEDPVRKGLFSTLRADFEEYVFLKTLQKMTEPNGSIPITTMLKTTEKQNNDIKQPTSGIDPVVAGLSSNQIYLRYSYNDQSRAKDLNPIQTGRVVKVPLVKKQDQSIDTDFAKNFLNFHYVPVEAMEYVKERIIEIEKNLILTATGDYFEPNRDAINERQVKQGDRSREDALRFFGNEMTRVRELSDFKMLALQHGRDNVKVDVFFGSDFFIDTEESLYERLQNAPNPIEKDQIIVKLTKNRSRFNKVKLERDLIFYHLLPFMTNAEFQKAIDRGDINEEVFKLQNQFSFWISLFEAQFGDIVVFWNEVLEGASDAEKVMTINNLLITIIRQSDGNISEDRREEASASAS